MTVRWPSHMRGANRRVMIADDLGLASLRTPHDPLLLAGGILAPRLSSKSVAAMRNRAAWVVATTVAKSRPRTEAQRERNALRGTVAAKAIRDEVNDILSRYRRLGEVRG